MLLHTYWFKICLRTYSCIYVKNSYLSFRVNSGEVVGVKPCQLPFASQEYVEKEVKKLIDVEVVEPSVSLFSSLMVLVKKKDGSLRLRIDFRKLNSITIQ